MPTRLLSFLSARNDLRETEMDTNLTAASTVLFTSLVDDAGNWSGTPEINVTPAQKGNLTDLKRAGLLTTQMDRGIAFAYFTRKGVELARSLGLDWESLELY